MKFINILGATALLFTTLNAGEATNERTGFTSDNLQEVINNADFNDVINLHGTFFGNFNNNGKSLILRGSEDHPTILDAENNGRVFQVNNGITYPVVVKFERLTIQNGSVTSNGGGISNDDDLYNTVIVKDSVIQRNNANNGGGISNSGVLIIDGSKIYKNEAAGSEGYGGGIFFYPDSFAIMTMINSKVSRNTAQVDGGGLYLEFFLETGPGTTSVNFVHSKITKNEAGNDGGGLFAHNLAYSAYDTKFTKNRAISGGGVLDEIGTLFFVKTKIENNESSEAGGGIFLFNSKLGLYDSSVSENSSGDIGGGLFANRAIFDCFDTKFEENRATNGGGFYVTNATTTYLNDVQIERNEAYDGNGGGIYNDDSTSFTGEYVKIHKNTAYVAGGGIFNQGQLGLFRSHVTENTAVTNFGGGIFNDDQGLLTLTDTEVKHNNPDDIFID